MQLETPMPGVAPDASDVSVTSSAADRPFVISVEFLAYLALFAFALLLRVAELDSTPLMQSEVHNALAAWRTVMPNVTGSPLVSSSPILFALQSLSFTLFGGSELTARITTVIGSVVLIFTPALFRPLIGRTRAFLISLLVAFSPVLLIASRSGSPDVWALLCAVLSLWAYWKAGSNDQPRYPIFAVIMFAALIFLSGSGGFALAVILLIAAALTAIWRRRVLMGDEDDAPDGSFAALRRSLTVALPLALLVVLAISTGFMLFPAGLSAVGEVIGGALRAVVQPQGASGYATLVALFYEPILWLLALVGVLIRRERLTTLDVFLIVWVVLGIVVTLFFADGSPDHALWLTVPLAVLATHSLLWIFSPDEGIAYVAAPRWARIVIAVSAIGVLAVFTIAFQSTARSMVQAPQPLLTMVSPPPDSVILVLVSLMFLVIGFFLFASLWGGRTSWQGLGLGLAIFGAVTSLGAGWNAAVPNSQNPVSFWHMQATNNDTALLRSTLFDVAARVSGGWSSMPIDVLASDDSEIAWLLRDFTKAQYISQVSQAANAEVVLLPDSIQQPTLGGAYVGQKFTISRTWDTSTLNTIDLPAWWTQQQARTAWTSQDIFVFWLRQDVYEGLNQSQTPQGY